MSPERRAEYESDAREFEGMFIGTSAQLRLTLDDLVTHIQKRLRIPEFADWLTRRLSK